MSDFTWKGTAASSKGIIVSEYPPIFRPEERLEMVQVPGRSGELYLTLDEPVFNAYTKECICYFDPTSKNIEDIKTWLSGAGDVKFHNELDYLYEARILYQIPFEKILRGRPHRTFIVPFHCQPLKKKSTTEADIVMTASGGTITNPGSVSSRPRIKVEGSGNIGLMIGTATITNITGLSGAIVIDSDVGVAFDATGTQNMSYFVQGDWPRIPAGDSPVSWTGTVSKVTITPRWRYL